MSELVSIVYKPKDARPSGEDYARVPLQQALLVVGHGIDGDAKGGVATRQLNIMSAHTLQALAGEGFRTAPGQMGEQLVLMGLEVDTLPHGTRLQIGAQACVELIAARTGCATFERHQGKPRQAAASRLGMMARVVAGGVIAVGDPVQVVAQADPKE
jgi:MOSC domain-containing protein YiiM